MKEEFTKEELKSIKMLLNRLGRTLTDEESPYRPFYHELMPQIEKLIKKIDKNIK